MSNLPHDTPLPCDPAIAPLERLLIGPQSPARGEVTSLTPSPLVGRVGEADFPSRLGIVACGALAREVLAVTRQLSHIETRFLPAKLHAYPAKIPAAVDEALTEISGNCEKLFVAYADCGTAGALDKVLAKHNATRLPGAHCYALFAGVEAFDALQDAEPGTFYLTDYLARQFETLVIEPLGLDRHPELRDDYFQHYTRLLYLAQTDDAALDAAARAAAARLGLRFERRFTGIGAIEREIAGAAA